MPADDQLQSFIDQMNSDISEMLKIEEREDTLENRLEIMNDFLDDFKKQDLPDSFINRTIMLMFEFFAENMTRQSQGLEPIPFQ
jgi:FKBP-type peptidyl-prolyl cis-trans isomerase (trigger factor)